MPILHLENTLIEPQIFQSGDSLKISNYKVLIWKGYWDHVDTNTLIDGDIWLPILEDSPPEELLKRSKELQTKPCPKCTGTMVYQRGSCKVQWQQKFKFFDAVGWYCPGTAVPDHPESLGFNNCGHQIFDAKHFDLYESHRISLIDFQLFYNAEALARFFSDNPGPWEIHQDRIRRLLGWENKTTCQHVGVTLTWLKLLDPKWRHHFQTIESRSNFPKWCGFSDWDVEE